MAAPEVKCLVARDTKQSARKNALTISAKHPRHMQLLSSDSFYFSTLTEVLAVKRLTTRHVVSTVRAIRHQEAGPVVCGLGRRRNVYGPLSVGSYLHAFQTEQGKNRGVGQDNVALSGPCVPYGAPDPGPSRTTPPVRLVSDSFLAQDQA